MNAQKALKSLRWFTAQYFECSYQVCFLSKAWCTVRKHLLTSLEVTNACHHGDTSNSTIIVVALTNFPHIRNTPKRGASSTGAFNAAANANPSTSLVCAGSMMPSSHSRAVAW